MRDKNASGPQDTQQGAAQGAFPIPVYEQELQIGGISFMVLTTSRPSEWLYGSYQVDFDAEPIGYLSGDLPQTGEQDNE